MKLLDKKGFLKAIEKEVTAILNEKGNELVDITFRSERGGMTLRITVDGPKVSLDDCAEISRRVSGWLDEKEEEIPYDKYNLEVSTPGLDRPLKKARDFERVVGSLIRLETKKKDETGRKRYNGRIEGVSGDEIEIYAETESKTFKFNINDIAKARLEVEL